MSIEVREVTGWSADGADETQGVVLVDTVTGLPLPLSIHALPDVETAERYLEQLGTDARLLTADQLGRHVREYLLAQRGEVTR